MSSWLRIGDNEPEILNFNSALGIDGIELIIDEFICEIEHESQDKKPKDTLGKKFIGLVQQGYKPGQAARMVGTSIKGLMDKKFVDKKVRELVEGYHMRADLRRQLTRAGMNKLAMEGLNSTDIGERKLALDALKAIGSDTEVGINAPPAPGIQINVGNLAGLFTDIPDNDIIDLQAEDIEVLKTEEKEKYALECGTEILDASELSNLAPESEED